MRAVRLGLRFLLVGVLLSSPLRGQEAKVATPEKPRPEAPEESRVEEPIETDRDSFTPATTTVGKDRLVIESAYSFLENRGTFETHSFPELLVRYGLTENLELRLGWNYEVGGNGNEISGSQGDELFSRPGLERESRITYGVKVALTRQKEWLPTSALIVQGFTPTSGDATATQMVATYAFGWELFEKWKLDAAIRYGTASELEDRFSIWAPSIVLKIPVGERVNIHAEYFGIFAADSGADFVRHYISPGVHFLLTDDLELGVRLGWGLNDQSARFFVNAGVGARF